MQTLLALTLCLLLLSALAQQDNPDKITPSQIPQFPSTYPHDIYGGYLTLTEYDKQIYYMLFMSQSEGDNDPLLLWLNGGPGCSSLIGMAMENGPFVFGSGAREMKDNPYAWNKDASVLYLQAPAGVGFSKAKKQSMSSSDTIFAQDTYLSLIKFFQRYPELKDNDFYIAGESYAGTYIPRLAQEIISNNQQQSAQDRKINIKGILIGNGCTHPTECYSKKYVSRYQVDYLYTRGFIDLADYSEYRSACVNSQMEKSTACLNIQQKIDTAFTSSKANIYNVYGQCYTSTTGSIHYNEKLLKLNELTQQGKLQYSLKCMDNTGMNILFNSDQNRPALHIESNETLKWAPCSDTVTNSYTMQPRAAYTTLPSLVKYGLKIFYYSGDFDAMVPIQGTVDWLNKYRADFGASVKKNWRPWSMDKGQSVSGMVWHLDGIVFYSVFGAGHMVPVDKPREAKYLLDVFLEKLSSEEEAELQQKVVLGES